MVHIENRNIDNILFGFYRDGVLVVSVYRGNNRITNTPNWEIKAIARQMMSKGYLEVCKSWTNLYYKLNSKGEMYLKKKLNIPDTIQPKMMESSLVADQNKLARSAAGEKDPSKLDKAVNLKEANLGVPASENLEFRGGFRGPNLN
ncbi:MAG: ribosomal 40S subunit protein S10A [Paramarteilia canceri]